MQKLTPIKIILIMSTFPIIIYFIGIYNEDAAIIIGVIFAIICQSLRFRLLEWYRDNLINKDKK